MIHFLYFWTQDGDLPSRTTNDSVHYHHRLGFAFLMDIAATVVSTNRCPSKKMFPNLFLHLVVLFLHGFMYFPSQPQHPLVVHKLHPLLIWRLYCFTEPIVVVVFFTFPWDGESAQLKPQLINVPNKEKITLNRPTISLPIAERAIKTLGVTNCMDYFKEICSITPG